MSAQLVKWLIAGVLFVHGVGHTLGFWMPARSWLLPNAPEPALRIVSSVVWGLSCLGFLASLLGFLGIVVPTAWWRPLATITAFISLLGLALFWNTWGGLNKIGALVVNLTVLATQLWLHWPPEDLLGR